MSLLETIASFGTSALGGSVLGIVSRLGAAYFEYKAQDQKIALEKLRMENERETLRLQLDAQRQLDKDKFDLTALKGEISEAITSLRGAIELQLKPSGIKWVDAWTGTLRPILFSTFILGFWAYKVLQTIAVFVDPKGWTLENVMAVWGPTELAIFVGIVNFLIVGRVLDKQRHGK